MTALFDARYTVGQLPSREGVFPAYDEMLDRPVEILLFDAVPDPVERGRLLRRLRRSGAEFPEPARAVTDSGSVDDRPFLVVRRERPLSDVLPLPVEGVVAVVLDSVARLQELRRAGLAPLSLKPELLRLGRAGVRILPAPGRTRQDLGPHGSPAAGGPDGPDTGTPPGEDVRAVGSLLAQLISRATDSGGDRLDLIAARASGSAGPPVPDLASLCEELRAWQKEPPAAHGPSPVRQDRQPDTSPGTEPPPAPRTVAPSVLDEPTELIRRPERVPAPVDDAAPSRPDGDDTRESEDPGENSDDEGYDAPDPYVPLSSLLHDEDEDEEPPHPRWRHLRQGPRHES